ncbi:hypothetical protein [Actinoplanes flavus]|uniref:Uncharacterized protein n=1 Tax=Actinoplanes flavus TaxID=2820290 RepID=A0ABS3UFF6_9ACTN|nr:hypothetical protein [Actinoplanes flavus]MBO3737494.1 hypothetical protein [Actinoplanes flavus]
MLDHGRGDGVHEALRLAPGMTGEQSRETGRLAGREGDAELLTRQASGRGAEPQLDQAQGRGDAESQDQQRQQQNEARGAED